MLNEKWEIMHCIDYVCAKWVHCLHMCVFLLLQVYVTSPSRCLYLKSVLVDTFRSKRQIILSPCFHTLSPLQSVNASPLTSQGCCLCTVLLCHRRLVPLGLCTLIPLSFLGAGPVFSQGSFLCEPAQPLSLSACHSPFSTHTKYHGPQVWKPQNKRASSLFWGMLQDVQVSEDIKEREKNATTK